jgi:hypothetical protein
MIKEGGGCGWIMYHEQRKKKEHTELWSQKQKAINFLENKALCRTKLTEEQDMKKGNGFN